MNVLEFLIGSKIMVSLKKVQLKGKLQEPSHDDQVVSEKLCLLLSNLMRKLVSMKMIWMKFSNAASLGRTRAFVRVDLAIASYWLLSYIGFNSLDSFRHLSFLPIHVALFPALLLGAKLLHYLFC